MTAPAMQPHPPATKPSLPGTMRELLVAVVTAFAKHRPLDRRARMDVDDAMAAYLLQLQGLEIPAVAWAVRELLTEGGKWWPDPETVKRKALRWRPPGVPVSTTRVIGAIAPPTGKPLDRKAPCLFCSGALDPYGHVEHETGCIRAAFAGEFDRARAMRELGFKAGQILTGEQQRQLDQAMGIAPAHDSQPETGDT